jgi:hypothetical protein
MYYHTLEDKRYSKKHGTYPPYLAGFHYCAKKFLPTDTVHPSPPSLHGLWGAGFVAGVRNNCVPANITDKETADAICAYLNANPAPPGERLTPEVLGRALTALGYGTLEEYLAPKSVANRTVSNPFKPLSDTFNPNRYIRQSNKGMFTVTFRGVSIPQLPDHDTAVRTIDAIRQGFAQGVGDVRAYAIAATQLEDLA